MKRNGSNKRNRNKREVQVGKSKRKWDKNNKATSKHIKANGYVFITAWTIVSINKSLYKTCEWKENPNREKQDKTFLKKKGPWHNRQQKIINKMHTHPSTVNKQGCQPSRILRPFSFNPSRPIFLLKNDKIYYIILGLIFTVMRLCHP